MFFFLIFCNVWVLTTVSLGMITSSPTIMSSLTYLSMMSSIFSVGNLIEFMDSPLSLLITRLLAVANTSLPKAPGKAVACALPMTPFLAPLAEKKYSAGVNPSA